MQVQQAGSSAKHAPQVYITERWEAPYIYGFITRFTMLKKRVVSLNTPMDFEDAVVSESATPIMRAVLTEFIHNLWRGSMKDCDCSSDDGIETCLFSVFDLYCQLSDDRSSYWSSSKNRNVNPFIKVRSYFTADLDFKLNVLRQLVDWQLSHCEAVKSVIDEAWGVKHKVTSKKKIAKMEKVAKTATNDASLSLIPGPASTKEEITMAPIGLDFERQRYWAADDSARVWCSNNPWKKSSYMKVASSSQAEYIVAIETVKAKQPPIVPRSRRGRHEKAHDQLLAALGKRLPIIEDEAKRVEAMFAKLDRKAAADTRAAELAESRQIRTRLRTRLAGEYSDGGSVGMSRDPSAVRSIGGSDSSDLTSVYKEEGVDEASQSTHSNFTQENRSDARKRKASPLGGRRRSRRHMSVSDDDPAVDIEPQEEALQLADPIGSELRVKKRRILSPTMDDDVLMMPSLTKKRLPDAFSGPRRTNAVPSTSAGSSNGDRRSSDTPSLLSDKNTTEPDHSESSSLSSLSEGSDDEP